MKKIIITIIIVALISISCIGLTACNNNEPVIGIIQFGPHGSLNNCYTGIIDGLEETIDLSGYKVEYLNSNFNAETSLSQANSLVNKKAKVIIAIATPSAMQAATAASGKGVPVVYCAVTDQSQMDNFSNITGTSDIPDFNAQLKIVSGFFSKTDIKIGVLMSSDESSDPLQLTMLKKAAKSYAGMSIIDRTVSDITTIETHVKALVSDSKVDCIVNLLDNTIVGQLDTILAITNEAGIPVFGSEIEQVKKGCLASASIDYITVGKLAGRQAAEILGGKAADEVARKTMENETYPYYNSTILTRFTDLKLPNIEGLKDVKEN